MSSRPSGRCKGEVERGGGEKQTYTLHESLLGLIIDPSTYLPLESGGIKNNPDAGCSGEVVGRREENDGSDSENGGVSSRSSGRCKVELEPGGGKKQPPPPRVMSPISSRRGDRARRSHDGKVFLTQGAFVTHMTRATQVRSN